VGVRNERVVLSLQDAGFSTGMATAAANAALLDRNLDRLDGTSVDFDQSLRRTSKTVDKSGAAFRKNALDIDSFSGRLGLATRAVAAFGPALVPLTAQAAPAIAGLSAGLLSVATGTIVVASAFRGVGDALGAVNMAALEPTAANLDAAREAMEGLVPAARDAVKAMSEWSFLFWDIREAGAASFFPGVAEGLEELQATAPVLERIFATVGEAAGSLVEDAAGWISGPEGMAFLEFWQQEAPGALTAFGTAAGNVTVGLAELLMAMDPASDGFMNGLVGATERFREWADGLAQTEGFQQFLAYLRETGPQVAETVGAIANALVQVAQAAAPVGALLLPILEALADVISTIADSDLGTPIMAAVAAMSALSIASRGLEKLNTVKALATFTTDVERANAAMKVTRPTMRDFGRVLVYGGQGAEQLTRQMQSSSAAISAHSREVAKSKLHVRSWLTANKAMAGGAVALGAGFAASQAGLVGVNTAMGAAIGMMAGPWGAAVGAGVGALVDLAKYSDDATASTEALAASLEQLAVSGTAISSESKAALQRQYQDRLDEYTKTKNLIEGLNADGSEMTIEELKDSAFDADWADYKNELTGLWGDTDLERQKAALDQAETDLRRIEEAANDEARALGFASSEARRHADVLMAGVQGAAGFEASLNRLHDTVKEGSRAFNKNGDLVRGATDEQVAAASALYGTVDAFKALSPAERQARGGMKRARAEFVNAAGAMGMSRDAARELFNELMGLDGTNATPTVTLQGVGSAVDGANQVRNAIDRIKDKTVRVTVIRGILTNGELGQGTEGQGKGVYTNEFKDQISGDWRGARGSLIEAYAHGGIRDAANRHMPEIARPRRNTVRVWAEPETQGESYIPHANDFRRPRAKRVLERTADVLGGEVHWFAGGGLRVNPSNFAPAAAPAATATNLGMAALQAEVKALRRDVRQSSANNARESTRGLNDVAARSRRKMKGL
jgi:hypothetical protein